MQAKESKKNCSRGGWPSTRLISRRDQADYCEFHFSNQMTRANIFFGPMERSFSRDFHGRGWEEWDI